MPAQIFHLKANARRRKNFIPSLKDQHANFLWSQEEKEAEILRYFAAALGTRENRTCTFNWEDLELETVQLDGLDREFSEREIWNAISQMPAEKAPGRMVLRGISTSLAGLS